MEIERDELRQALSTLGPRGRGKPYPKGLLEKLLSYTVAKRRAGASIVEVAAELGMSFRTLGRWMAGRSPRRGFKRVEVVRAANPSQPLIVHGPRGLRIEGLDVAGVAELVRRVGE